MSPGVVRLAQAMDHVMNSVRRWGGPPQGLTGRGAFGELQARHVYSGEPIHVADRLT